MEKNIAWNPNEQKVLKMFERCGTVSLDDLERAFSNVRVKKGKKQVGLSEAQRNSWARNSIRRLVSFHIIKKVARGTYEMVGTAGLTKAPAATDTKTTKTAEAKPAEVKAAKTAAKPKKTRKPKKEKAPTVKAAPAPTEQPPAPQSAEAPVSEPATQPTVADQPAPTLL